MILGLPLETVLAVAVAFLVIVAVLLLWGLHFQEEER
jgi:hypothetical protein